MSNASSNISPSLNTVMNRRKFWVDTHYFDLKPHTISNMAYEATWTSEKIKSKYLDIELEFQFVRLNKQEFRFNCIRNPVSLIPGDYILEFHFSFNALNQDPYVLVLQSNRFMVHHIYNLDSAFCSTIPPNAGSAELELKVLVKMIEFKCEPAGKYSHQEEEFEEMKIKFFNIESVLKDLCYILNIPIVKYIFSGLQNNEFAALKTTYITRTAEFARKIAGYMKAKDACIPVSNFDLGVTLNYILNGERKPICVEDLFKVYFEAHHMGLNFLVDLSRDAILDRLENQNFLILLKKEKSELHEVLKAAERVDDRVLFEKIAEKFRSPETRLLVTVLLANLTTSGIEERCVVRSLIKAYPKPKSEGPI